MANLNQQHPFEFRPSEPNGHRNQGDQRWLLWMAVITVVLLVFGGALAVGVGYLAMRPAVKDAKFLLTPKPDHESDRRAFQKSVEGFAQQNLRPLGQTVDGPAPFVSVSGEAHLGDASDTDLGKIESVAADLHQWVLQTSDMYMAGESPGPIDIDGFMDAMARSPYGPLRNFQRMLVRDNIDAAFLIPDVLADTRVVGIEFPRDANGKVQTDVARVDLITGSSDEFAFSIQWFVRRGKQDWKIYDWQRLEYGRRQSDEMVDYIVCSDTVCRYDQSLEKMGDAVNKWENGNRKEAVREATDAYAIRVRPVNRVAHQLRSAWTMEHLEMFEESETAFKKLFDERHFGCEPSLALAAIRNGDMELGKEILRRVQATDPNHPTTATLVQLVAPRLLAGETLSASEQRELRQSLIDAERILALFEPQYETVWSSLIARLGDDIDLIQPVFDNLDLSEESLPKWIALLESVRWDPAAARTVERLTKGLASTPAIIRQLSEVVRRQAESDSDAAVAMLTPIYQTDDPDHPAELRDWIRHNFHELHYEAETFTDWFSDARNPEECLDYCFETWWDDLFYIQDVDDFLMELDRLPGVKAKLLRGLVLHDADRDEEALESLEDYLSEAQKTELAAEMMVDNEVLVFSEPVFESVEDTVASILVERNRYREVIERFPHLEYTMQRLAQRLIYQNSDPQIQKLTPALEDALGRKHPILSGLSAVIYGDRGEANYPSYRRKMVESGEELLWPESIVRDAALRQWVALMVAHREPSEPYANAIFRNDEVGDSLIPWIVQHAMLCGNQRWYENALQRVPLHLSRMSPEKQREFVNHLFQVLSRRGWKQDRQHMHDLLRTCIATEDVQFSPWVLESVIKTHLVHGDAESAAELIRWHRDLSQGQDQTSVQLSKLTDWIESGARIEDVVWDQLPEETAAQWAFDSVIAANLDREALIQLRRRHGVSRSPLRSSRQQTVEWFAGSAWEIDAAWIERLLQTSDIAFDSVRAVENTPQTWAVMLEKGSPMVVSTTEYEPPKTVACPQDWLDIFVANRHALRISGTETPHHQEAWLSDLGVGLLTDKSIGEKAKWVRENETDVFRAPEYLTRYRDRKPIRVANWFEPPYLIQVSDEADDEATDVFLSSDSSVPDIEEFGRRLKSNEDPIEVLVSLNFGLLEERLRGHVVSVGESSATEDEKRLVVELVEDSRYDQALQRGMRVHTHSYHVREIE